VSLSENDDGRRTAWTLGAIKRCNLALEGHCQTEGCGRFYALCMIRLLDEVVADMRTLPEDEQDRIAEVVCRMAETRQAARCGARKRGAAERLPPILSRAKRSGSSGRPSIHNELRTEVAALLALLGLPPWPATNGQRI
jgi:hypothetical protein